MTKAVYSNDQPTITAFLLRRARQRAGLMSLAQVAERLGATSIDVYARYEQGRSLPTIQKLSELFATAIGRIEHNAGHVTIETRLKVPRVLGSSLDIRLTAA
jgi:transcriptional regulator with XRE-family HTH domain